MNSKWFLFVIFSLLFSFTMTVEAAKISDTLSQVQLLMKQKNYVSARNLLKEELEADRTSYKLWLALGYVYEAEENLPKALEVFMVASELKEDIPGLNERIDRLQKAMKTSVEDSIQLQNLSPIERAKHFMSVGKELEALKIFYDAVEQDRSLLSNDYGMIQKGLVFFKANYKNFPDALFYLGAYHYYSGQYVKAALLLSSYLEAEKTSDKVEDAKRLLNESREIIKQAKAKKPEPGKNPPQPVVNTASNANTGASLTELLDNPEVPEEIVMTNSVAGELFAVTEAKQRIEKLIQEYDEEADNRKRLQIIWRIGLIGIPTPEVMAKFADFLNSNDIETIFATLEALGKIGIPGARICAPYMVALLDHDDFRIRLKTVQALAKIPMLASRSVPKLLKMYHSEQLSIRQGLIVKTLFAYGSEGQDVLKKMLQDAIGPNKRPIAEVLSILTGENVEALIRDN